MRRSAALVLALALALSGARALAKTSAPQDGAFSVPYQCGLAPVNVPMIVNGDESVGVDLTSILHNSDTDLGIGSVQINSPWGVNPPELSSDIVITGPSGAALLAATRGNGNGKGKGLATAKGQIKRTGLANDRATTTLRVLTREAAFRAGAYSVTVNLTCSQAPQ